MSATTPMTPRQRIRNGLFGLPTGPVPPHCRLRMAPLTKDLPRECERKLFTAIATAAAEAQRGDIT